MKYMMTPEQFEVLKKFKELNESRTSEEAMNDIEEHDEYFVIRIELVKLSRNHKKLEYTHLYSNLESQKIMSCIRGENKKLYDLPHGVYVMPTAGTDLKKVERLVIKVLEDSLKPFYPISYIKKYTTLICGPTKVTFQNLDEINDLK